MDEQADVELLLRVVLQFAQSQIEKIAGFHPFGAGMGSKRDVQLLVANQKRKDLTIVELEGH